VLRHSELLLEKLSKRVIAETRPRHGRSVGAAAQLATQQFKVQHATSVAA
jgi:hypothetical protein